MIRKVVVRGLLAVLILPVLAYSVTAAMTGRDAVWESWFGKRELKVKPANFAALDLPETPNWFLLCPPGQCGDAAAPSPVFAMPPAELRDSVMTLIQAEPDVEILASDPQNLQYELLARTKWLRFPDSISIRFVDLPEGSGLQILSRSHYGREDFGANKARVEGWLARIGL